MTLPFAALIAVIAAILESSVLAELPLAGATADLVLVCATVATLVLGVEDGLVLAFIGGLLIDMLIPSRPLGAATLAMLLTLGIAFFVARAVGPGRRLVSIGVVLILTAVFHVLFALILVPTAEAPFAIDPTVILVAAVLNALLAIPVAALFGSIERRFGPTERADW
ncbi:MAG: rod shape-determining protein MreD [Chloroflexota bacterium]